MSNLRAEIRGRRKARRSLMASIVIAAMFEYSLELMCRGGRKMGRFLLLGVRTRIQDVACGRHFFGLVRANGKAIFL